MRPLLCLCTPFFKNKESDVVCQCVHFRHQQQQQQPKTCHRTSAAVPPLPAKPPRWWTCWRTLRIFRASARAGRDHEGICQNRWHSSTDNSCLRVLVSAWTRKEHEASCWNKRRVPLRRTSAASIQGVVWMERVIMLGRLQLDGQSEGAWLSGFIVIPTCDIVSSPPTHIIPVQQLTPACQADGGRNHRSAPERSSLSTGLCIGQPTAPSKQLIIVNLTVYQTANDRYQTAHHHQPDCVLDSWHSSSTSTGLYQTADIDSSSSSTGLCIRQLT